MSERTPRFFTTGFKERAVLRLEAGASASALADLSDSDWPSLEGSSFLDADDDLASQAGEELREFAGGQEEGSKDVADGSQLWGS